MLLKKLVSYFLLPFPLVLLLLLAGTWLLWFTRKQRTGKVLVTAGVFIILVASWSVTSGWLSAALERSRPLANVADAAGARWVVVLGSGYSTSAGVPPNGRLDGAGLERLVEGVRLVRAIAGSKLVVSGGPIYGGVSQAEVMAEVALSLGTPRADIVLEARSDDTQDEARFVHEIVGADRFVLVTSVIHMRRSLALFEKQGMKPIPAPAGFWPNQRSWFPTSGNLVRADHADHEYLGMLWSLLRGTM
jgi:uncharacterized SAM-binding protein YcdF (DUF218 family)